MINVFKNKLRLVLLFFFTVLLGIGIAFNITTETKTAHALINNTNNPFNLPLNVEQTVDWLNLNNTYTGIYELPVSDFTLSIKIYNTTFKKNLKSPVNANPPVFGFNTVGIISDCSIDEFELYYYDTNGNKITVVNHTEMIDKNTPILETNLADGVYYIDAYYHYKNVWLNNITSSFTIDTTPPELTINGDKSANFVFSNKFIDVTYNDNIKVTSSYYSYTKSGNFSTSATEISSTRIETLYNTGNYYLKVSDAVGNIVEKYCTIDRNAPVIKFSSDITSENTSTVATKKPPKVSWSTAKEGVYGQLANEYDELTCYWTKTTGINEIPKIVDAKTEYTSDTELNEGEGWYLFVLYDKAGNYSFLNVIYDTTAPTYSLTGVENNGFTSSNPYFYSATTIYNYGAGLHFSHDTDTITTNYSYSITKEFPTSTNTKFNGVYSFSTEGNYFVTVTDKAGNINSCKFTIDKTAPVLTFNNVTTTKNGIIFSKNNKVTVNSNSNPTVDGVGGQLTNKNDTVTVKYSYLTTGSFPTTADTVLDCSLGSATLTEAGNYLITATDKAGNTSSYKLTIDRTAPTLTLNGVTAKGFTNNNVSLTWNSGLGITSDLSNSSDALSCYYNIGGSSTYPNTANNNHTSYNKGSSLSAIGHYSVTIFDTAGNSTSYNFTIDKTAPVFTVTPLKEKFIKEDNTTITKDGFTLTYGTNFINDETKEEGITGQRCKSDDELIIWYSFSKDAFPSSAETNITAVYNGTKYTEEGYYLIKLQDKAGNYTTQKIHINKQAPTFKVYTLSMTELPSEHFAYNQSIKISFDNSLTATINGQAYTSETAIIEEGEYNLVIKDVLGNEITQILRIIKTLPTQNYNALKTPNAKWWETTNTDGENYAFDDYETAYKIADARERALLVQKEWTNSTWDGGVPIAPEDLSKASQGDSYYIYKSYTDKNVNHAYFSLSTLNASIEKYVSSSIKTNYLPKTPPVEHNGENVYRDIYFTKKPIIFNTIDNCFIFVDGVKQTYPYTLTSTGKHTITETDIAGNSITYSVYIDTDLPTVKASNLNGNMETELPYNFISYFTYGLILEVDDADEQSILIVNGTYYVNDTVKLVQAGKYEISTRDASGNTGSLTIYISLEEPTVTFTEIEVDEIVNSFTITINKNDTLSSLTNLEISRFNEGTGTWVKLTADNSSHSVEINIGTYFYEFSVTGQYRIILIDIFGRVIEEEYSFIKGSPKGQIYTSSGTELPNNVYTNRTVYFLWSDNLDCSAEIIKKGGNPLAYTKGAFVSEEGEYCIYLYSNVDTVFNYYYFTIDKTAPQGTLMTNSSSLVNGGTSRFPIALTWTESGCTATINGQPYASGTEIAEEGKWIITLTDRAGNSFDYKFTVKTSPPTISARSGGKELNNYGVTQRDVIINWSEYNCTCLVNNVEYPQNSRFVVEGNYTVVLTDAYGNSNKFFFTIDKTAPTGYFLINGVKTEYTGKKLLTNGKVAFIWEESDASTVLNTYHTYISGEILSSDGNYTFVLTDKAGNYSTYEVTIKQEPPKAILYANNLSVPSGSTTNGNVKLSWTESGCTATVNELTYTNGQLIKDEGFYKLELLDKFGNVASFEITIDKTAPVLEIYSADTLIENGEVIRNNAFVSWSEESCTATINGSSIENGTVISEEGEYLVVLTDIAGNETIISFILDKTAKIGTLVSKGQILQDGAITQNSAYFTWSAKGCSATLNGESYSNGRTISNEGDYTIILTDKAGNTYTISFTIDKTAPEGQLLFSADNVNNVTAGEVALTWEEDCTATINGQPYEKDTFISEEGELNFVLTDKAGNSTSYFASIDLTAPNLLVESASGDAFTSGSTTRFDFIVSWEEKNCTAIVNKETISNRSKFTETGKYVISLTDAVGNVTTFEITIDKTSPFIDIIVNGNKSYPYCSEGFSAVWTDETYIVLLNGQPYASGTEITAEGLYNIVVYNAVGNSTSYDITIDRTAPVGLFKLLDNTIVPTNYAIKNVYFSWEEEGVTATINGKPYLKNQTITKDGLYNFCLIDLSGNKTYYSFTVVKAKPEIIFYSQADEKIITSSRADAEDNVLVFANGMNDKIYLNDILYESEEPLAVGEYVFTIVNPYGNSATYSFTVKAPVEPVERESSGSLGKLFGGSKVGTTLFFSSLGIIAVLFVVVPVIRFKILKQNPIKKKLK